MKSIKLRVKGKVQGVYFRVTTKDIADQIGLQGIVKNESDGSVYIEIEGKIEQLDRFVDWCKHGPSKAHVSNIEVEETDIKNYVGFEIVY